MPPLPQPVRKRTAARRRQHPDQLELLLPFDRGDHKVHRGRLCGPSVRPSSCGDRLELWAFPILKDFDHVRHFPQLGSDAGRHRGSNFQGLMNSHEIVVHEIDRHHVRMVFGLFGEGVRQTRHAPVAHANVEVLALRKRSADVLRIGIAFDAMLARAGANRRAVAALPLRRRAVNLDQHRVVNISAERAFNGL